MKVSDHFSQIYTDLTATRKINGNIYGIKGLFDNLRGLENSSNGYLGVDIASFRKYIKTHVLKDTFDAPFSLKSA